MLVAVFTLACDLLGVVILLAVIYFLGRPIVHGAIYFPTSSRSVGRMMRLADITPGQKIADIGSGDGRVLIAAARRGAVAVGFEINPVLVRRSRRAMALAGVASKDPASSAEPGTARVEWESFWRADLSQFDVVFVYGIPYIMRGLYQKFSRELRPGTKVISNTYRFLDWEPVANEDGRVYLYVWP